ncbi:MAG: acetamidase/formamidase family protein [Defluviitaleaceae bacterium]|nr:acetamidase/formamidase family protein [Defluviitaleaceae bacterium]
MSTTVIVNKFTNGILDPSCEMLGPLESGGRMIVHTAPGCWGPMLTPKLRGGHEVTVPVFVQGAKPGDAVAITIESIVVTSDATSSGTDAAVDGRFTSDPFVAAKCANCGQEYPESEIQGTGIQAIVCKNCKSPVCAFEMPNGYTMVFDRERNIGITVSEQGAAAIASNARDMMQLPQNSVQNPVALLSRSDLQGTVSRLRPFIGQLGTTPSITFPDSHNAGDFGQFLIGASHGYAISEEDLTHRTDGHMDINKVRQGATVICPVKVDGAGVYVGDVHAMQGEGEIAGHTCDVSAICVLRIDLVKNMPIKGPIILPAADDIPYLAKPLTTEEIKRAETLAKAHNTNIEHSLPISFVGTGANLNNAIESGLNRASNLLDMSVDEVKNRVTISGAIEIGRAPGVVIITFRVPLIFIKNKQFEQILKLSY